MIMTTVIVVSVSVLAALVISYAIYGFACESAARGGWRPGLRDEEREVTAYLAEVGKAKVGKPVRASAAPPPASADFDRLILEQKRKTD